MLCRHITRQGVKDLTYHYMILWEEIGKEPGRTWLKYLRGSLTMKSGYGSECLSVWKDCSSASWSVLAKSEWRRGRCQARAWGTETMFAMDLCNFKKELSFSLLVSFLLLPSLFFNYLLWVRQSIHTKYPVSTITGAPCVYACSWSAFSHMRNYLHHRSLI